MEDLNKEKNIELIQFLNQEKQNRKINVKKIYTFYNKCLIKSIIDLKNKFINIENKNVCIDNGINMIYYIFFILIFYTNNIRLTIFLLERSILFYTEFIIMSQDKKLIDQICFVPNINDALFFTYKKTIGPLEIANMKVKEDQIFIREICKTINLIYKDSILNDNNNISNLNNIQKEISPDLYSLLSKISKDNTKKIHFLINEILSLDLVFRKKLFLIKLFITLCNDSNKKEYENIYKKILSEVDNITNFQIQNIKEYKIYKILINSNEL
jgi:hypothetical protein